MGGEDASRSEAERFAADRPGGNGEVPGVGEPSTDPTRDGHRPPRRAPRPDATEPLDTASSGFAPASGESPATIRVLLIEDDPLLAAVLRKMMGRTPRGAAGIVFRTEWADSLATGIDRLAGREFDAVLLDLMLPDSSGLGTLSRLREVYPGLPIVVLTALEEEALGIEAVRRGAQDYLDKAGIDGHLVSRALRYAIERAKGERHRVAQFAVARALAEAASLEEASVPILRSVAECLGWDWGALWKVDRPAGVIRCVATWHAPEIGGTEFQRATRRLEFAPGVGLPGRIWAGGTPLAIENIVADPATYPRAEAAAKDGLHGCSGFPIAIGGEVLGVMEFLSREARPPDADQLRTMGIIGSQIGQFIERKRAERAASESEARKAAVFETAPDALVTMDQHGRIIEFNPAAEKTFGYRRDAVIGRPMVELIVPPSLRKAHAQGLARHLATGQSDMLGRWVELSAMRSDGSEFPVELALTRVLTDDGPTFTGYIRDITERERQERDLIQQSLLAGLGAKVGLTLVQGDPLPTLLERCGEALIRFLEVTLARIWTFDAEAGVLELQACRGTLPCPREPRRIPFDPCRIDIAARAQARCRAGVMVDDVPEWLSREGAVSVAIHPLVIEGRLVGVMELFAHQELDEAARVALGPVVDAIAQCIERKRAEDRLRASEERLRILFEQMPGVLWTTDTELRFTSSSGTALTGLGSMQETPTGRVTLFEYFRTDDPAYLPIASHRRALCGDSVSYEMEWGGCTFQSHVEPLMDRDHRVVGCIGVALDSTPLKQAETALRRSLEEFRIAGEIQKVFYPKAMTAPAGFDIHGDSRPAVSAGGDCFDYVSLPDGGIGIAIGDVSGHGLGPALLMASTRAYLRAFASKYSDVGTILTKLNQVLLADVGDERFVTFALARLDPVTHSLAYANAGHTTGYVLDRTGEVRALLESNGLPLGLDPDGQYTSTGLVLEPGDLVLLLTDGVEEAGAAQDRPFGKERMLETVRLHRAEPASSIVAALHRTVLEFTRSEVQADDITTIVIKVELD